MIKFFRKIKQGLMIENNFSKYLIYAIGEIVLVVIGILIALSINNWNESEKLDNKTKNLIVRINRQVSQNLLHSQKYILRTEKRIDGIISLKSILDLISTIPGFFTLPFLCLQIRIPFIGQYASASGSLTP